MKTFNQFITEVYDKEMAGQASRAPGEGGRIRASRKKREIDKTRTKTIGGGKTVPSKDYKDRKDIGTNKPKSRTQQQPEKERGSAALSPREAQRKAAKERRAAKSGVKTKTADELLSKKTTKAVDPKYKVVRGKPGATPTKRAYSRAERQKITRAGERLVKDIKKKKEKPASSYDPKVG